MSGLLERPRLIWFPDPLVFTPAPPARFSRWWEQAACKGQPKPDLFVGDNERARTAAKRIRPFVNQYCRACPVLATCYEQDQQYGLWGGELRNGSKHPRLNLLVS